MYGVAHCRSHQRRIREKHEITHAIRSSISCRQGERQQHQATCGQAGSDPVHCLILQIHPRVLGDDKHPQDTDAGRQAGRYVEDGAPADGSILGQQPASNRSERPAEGCAGGEAGEGSGLGGTGWEGVGDDALRRIVSKNTAIRGTRRSEPLLQAKRCLSARRATKEERAKLAIAAAAPIPCRARITSIPISEGASPHPMLQRQNQLVPARNTFLWPYWGVFCQPKLLAER